MMTALKPSMTKRIFLSVAMIFVVLAGLVTATVIFFPYLVSSGWLKDRIESRLLRSTGRQVQLENVTWRWKGELRLIGILVPDTPAFSDEALATLAEARIDVSWNELIRNRVLVLDVALDGLSINLIRNRSGVTNIETLVSAVFPEGPETVTKEPVDSEPMKIWPVADLRGQIQLSGLAMQITDRVQERTVGLKDGRIDFKFPSVVKDPVTLTALVQVSIDHQKATPLSIDVKVSDFFDPEKRIDLDHLVMNLTAELPGTKISIDGNLARRQITGSLESDLAASMPLVSPFLPSDLADLETSGKLTLDLQVDGSVQTRPAFKAHLIGTRLFINGKVVKNVPVKLDTVNLFNQGSFNLKKSRLRITDGRLQLSRNKLKWHGFIDRSDPVSPTVQVVLEAISLDPGELLQLADRFMPAHLPRPGLGKTTHPARFEANAVKLNGRLGSGPLHIEISDATLSAPYVAVLETGRIRPRVEVEALQLSIFNLQAELVDLFPRRFTVSGSASLERLRFAGKNRLDLDQFRLSGFNLSADDIVVSPASQFGVVCRYSLTSSLQTGRIEYPPLLNLAGMTHSLSMDGRLSPDRLVEVALNNLSFRVTDLSVTDQHRGRLQATAELIAQVPQIRLTRLDPLKIAFKNPAASIKTSNITITHPKIRTAHPGGRAALSASRIVLNRTDPFEMDVRTLSAHLNLPGLMAFEIKADAANTGQSLINTSGRASLNLTHLAKTLALSDPGGTQAGGTAELTWHLSGRFPGQAALKQVTFESLLNSAPILSVIDRFDISCLLKDVDVDGLMKKYFGMRLGRITTATPLTYQYKKGGGASRFKGEVVAERITGMSSLSRGLATGVPPLSVRLGFSGAHHGLNDLTLSQQLKIDPLNIRETFECALSGIPALFNPDRRLTAGEWLSRLNGSAKLELKVQNSNQLQFLSQAIEIKGGADMEIGIHFLPEQAIDLQGRLRTAGMDVFVRDTLDVKNLGADIDFAKRYLIISKDAQKTPENRYLSSEVIQKNSLQKSEETGSRDPISFLKSPWDYHMGGRQRIRFESARIQLPPLSFKVDHVAADVEIVDGYPSLNYFQADLLGGSLIGGLRIFEKERQFFVKADVAFTGLDLKHMTIKGEDASDTEDYRVGGQMSVSFPLATRLSEPLEQLQLSLQFSHIGPRAIGRLLYLMDPYETNETIVSQRRILGNGTPKWIEIQVKDGILSLDGEVIVKGVRVKIPHLERLNIAQIAAPGRFDSKMSFIQPVIDVLDLTTRSTLLTGHGKAE